ncbi:MAG: PPOX class F420-dependent oxidoreductase [Actinomycetota bacterium]
MTSALENARYVSFTTYRRNGTPVPTAVWIVPFDGGWAFTSDLKSGKVKRLRNDARCTLQVCDMRGRVADGAEIFEGAAVVLPADQTATIESLVKSKYRIGWVLLLATEAARKITRRDRNDDDTGCAIKVTLHP